MEQDYNKTTWVDGSEPDIDAQHLNNIEDGMDGLYKPVFDDKGTVAGITDFPSFLAKVVSGMNPIAFYKNFKAGMKFVLHAGQLVNNGLCNIPGKYPLDAAYGKILVDMIGNVSELPGGAADVVAAITKQNSDLAAKLPYYSYQAPTTDDIDAAIKAGLTSVNGVASFVLRIHITAVAVFLLTVGCESGVYTAYGVEEGSKNSMLQTVIYEPGVYFKRSILPST